jgi:hypothetical protein
MKSVVATHVKYGNPQALEEMLAHRQGLIFDMRRRSHDGFDMSPYVDQLEDDVASILEGLEALNVHAGESADDESPEHGDTYARAFGHDAFAEHFDKPFGEHADPQSDERTPGHAEAGGHA